MSKELTYEQAAKRLKELQYAKAQMGQLSINDEIHKKALEIALPILEQQERGCQKCGGTGMADSGGTQPWGEQILIECDCKFEQQERGEGDGNLKHVGYLFVSSGGGVVYSPSGYGMRGFTCLGKIYADVNLQSERATNQNGEAP